MTYKRNYQNQPRWKESLRASLPVDLSYIPIGLACGVLLHASGFNVWMVLLVSVMVFSGGAQFLIASMLLINSPLFLIVLMLFFLELRYALLGSSLSKYLQGSSNWFTFMFSVSLNDENYAINYLKFSTDKNWTPEKAADVEHYTLLFWSVSNLIGSLIGNAIHIDLSIVEFALTSLFIYMIVMQIKDWLKLIVCAVAGLLSVFFLVLTKSTLGLVISTILASLVGFAIENYLRNLRIAGHRKSRLLRSFKNPAGSPKEQIDDQNATD